MKLFLSHLIKVFVILGISTYFLFSDDSFMILPMLIGMFMISAMISVGLVVISKLFNR